MKKSTCPTIGLLFTALFLIFSTSAFPQKITTWKGGAPGLENDWNCPKNWSTYAVPDEFSNVIIPDVSTTSLAPPVIKNGRVEVNTLFLDPNATFTLEEGAQLVIFEKVGSFLPLHFHPEGRIFLLDGTVGKSTAGDAAMMRK